MLKKILFTLFLASALPAGATDYTDIWWNPTESGWGVNFAQNGNFIFATFFVYGPPSNAPTWVTGQLTLGTDGGFTGPLYATTGPWYGTVPFDPAQVTINQVGNATFHPTAADTGTLIYNVGPVQVSKSIQRQTLAPIPLAGNYVGGGALTESGCPNPADNGSAQGPMNIQVTEATGLVDVTFDFFGAASCSFAGSPTQTGQLLTFPATYTCSNGFHASATVYELRATSLGVEGRWTSPDPGGGCHEEGRFSGVRS
jgi:hypothetical protein